jgi:hypothetical protein
MGGKELATASVMDEMDGREVLLAIEEHQHGSMIGDELLIGHDHASICPLTISTI